jgi:hypothetical protein
MNIASRIIITILIIVIAFLFGLLAVVKGISPDAVSAFIGVLVGSAITGIIQYRMSEADRQQQLRVAALDKRLEAHQRAYALWRKLLFADRSGSEMFDVAKECENWWENNCLYLSPQAREAFCKAYQSATDYASLFKIHADAELVKSTWQDVESAGKFIVEGANLPPLSELETKRL